MLVLLAMASNGAVGAPFEVRRESDQPALVRTASVHAVTSFAPFDDEAGSLTDGLSRFYVVDDVAGSPLLLSVNKNAVLQAVRLGFDDGDPTSADVDVARSTVDVAPAAIPADGVAVATVTIVPRDADGVALGAGLNVVVDVAALWPGAPRGALVDHGNGAYTFSVFSWTEGVGRAVATVEGRVLTDDPEITYTFAPLGGPSTDLLQIVDELQAIVDGDPEALSSGETGKAIEHLLRAVADIEAAPLNRFDAVHRIEKAIECLGRAVETDFDPVAAEDYMERLVNIARVLVVEAIDAAWVEGADATTIDSAESDLAAGDAAHAAGDFEKAAERYREAARTAEGVL